MDQKLASSRRHILALLIDLFLMILPAILVTLALWRGDMLPDEGKALVDLPMEQVYALMIIPLTAVGGMILWPFYNMIFIKYGGTFGKRWMGLTVVEEGGRPITWMSAFKREMLAKFLFPSFALMPFMVVLGNYALILVLLFVIYNYYKAHKTGQGVADKFAGTWVVSKINEKEMTKN